MDDLELVFGNVHGSVEYSASDKCWHGKILGIDDLITYEADSYDGIRQSFEDAVIDWQQSRLEVERKSSQAARRRI